LFKGSDLLKGIEDHCKVSIKNGQITAVEKNIEWQNEHQHRMSKIRGQNISMVFQEPASSLDPYFTVGEQLKEVIYHWNKCKNEKEAEELALGWLDRVAIKYPKIVLESYPSDLSGGMCQRVMIALALCSEPDLLIADEPTTALDVTIQKEILLLLQNLKEKLNLTILFITHDMNLVKVLADRVAVLYRGKILESGKTNDLFQEKNNIIHPFTKNLMTPFERINNTGGQHRTQSSFMAIKYEPDLGCVYYSECTPRKKICKEKHPPKLLVSDTHRLYCWLYEDLEYGTGNDQ
jgi:oligopeptide/dipeptide ABC transporter ATP-binding protein